MENIYVSTEYLDSVKDSAHYIDQFVSEMAGEEFDMFSKLLEVELWVMGIGELDGRAEDGRD